MLQGIRYTSLSQRKARHFLWRCAHTESSVTRRATRGCNTASRHPCVCRTLKTLHSLLCSVAILPVSFIPKPLLQSYFYISFRSLSGRCGLLYCICDNQILIPLHFHHLIRKSKLDHRFAIPVQ